MNQKVSKQCQHCKSKNEGRGRCAKKSRGSDEYQLQLPSRESSQCCTCSPSTEDVTLQSPQRRPATTDAAASAVSNHLFIVWEIVAAAEEEAGSAEEESASAAGADEESSLAAEMGAGRRKATANAAQDAISRHLQPIEGALDQERNCHASCCPCQETDGADATCNCSQVLEPCCTCSDARRRPRDAYGSPSLPQH